MNLSKSLKDKIVTITESSIMSADWHGYQAFCMNAGLNEIQSINYSARSKHSFVVLLLSTAEGYGSLNNGTNSIIAILETVRSQVGLEKQLQCTKLINEVSEELKLGLKDTYVLQEPIISNTSISINYSQKVVTLSITFDNDIDREGILNLLRGNTPNIIEYSVTERYVL